MNFNKPIKARQEFSCFARLLLHSAILLFAFCFAPPTAFAQNGFEDVPISAVEVTFENSKDNVTRERLEELAKRHLDNNYSAVKTREALEALYKSGEVAAARVEVLEAGDQIRRSLRVRFVIRRTLTVERVTVNVGTQEGENNITEEELQVRLNLLSPGTTLTQRALGQSADQIQSYLRQRGYYNAQVSFEQQPGRFQTRVITVFNVVPGEQARVRNLNLNISGFDNNKLRDEIQLKRDVYFTQEKLNQDLEKIRQELVEADFLGADIEDPRVTVDSENNVVDIAIIGNVNAKVEVKIENAEGKEIDLSQRTQRDLLPIKREGTLDFSAIEEGSRRLENHFQEQGYFFAQVTPICGIEQMSPDQASGFINNTQAACNLLSSENLQGKNAYVTYRAELNRRLRLTEIRITGTDKLPIEEVRPALRTQEANALGIVPVLGYGRGYTSEEILADDEGTIETLMREQGYLEADARVLQGVSPDGENLIITFAVTEGPLTRVADVDIVGNTAFSDDRLKAELPPLQGNPLSRARTRRGNTRILDLYAREGYIEARSEFSTEQVPSPNVNERAVRVIYTITQEGAKTFINRIVPVGNENVKSEAIRETIPIKPGQLLQADQLTESERNLYATDAFRQANITTEPAGTKEDGSGLLRDVFINIEESPPRILSYGGGVSTDEGPRGFVDIRHVNLLGSLYQGGARIQMSRRQQLIQLNFTNPRFMQEADGRFAPLTFTAQYLRDTGVTRFFRTTLDQGAMGIVQRLDEEGNPIDEFGRATGEPSINRLSFNLETSRTLNRQTRSLLFVRYRYEDVRLRNISSLLVAPLLQPDRITRISGVGATFARDTRQNCNNRRTLLERIRTGEDGDPCRYNATDATTGDFLSVDYQLSAHFLGGNVSFNRINATYQRYFQFKRLNNTVLAGRATLGAASLFSIRDRDRNGTIDETDQTLPISERFFGGGSTTLRGFAYEEAGPRRVIVPQGQFRNQEGNLITIPPFTVPVGGNALAILNLEARVPLTSFFQVVPFYDGGNVFRRVGEIFKPRASTPEDIDNFNLRALWTNTVGLGFRLRLPIGGSFAVDYGYLLNPPEFLVPQNPPTPPAVYRLRQGQLHFRFTQAF
ncbi:MAG: BamA/TamA family outer membrane protein [Acidobacteriota bacterium]|nr:BamA/TamA family outer membrane protein [Acidobacteriota bacterium]